MIQYPVKPETEDTRMRDLFLIVDGNSLLHRAFHALPLMDYEGQYTNALHGQSPLVRRGL